MIKHRERGRSKAMSEINVVPYIDVMLVLLVIFMITAPILTQGITVDLPKAASKSLPPTEREPVIVSVDAQGNFYLNIAPSPDLPMAANSILLNVAAELKLATEEGSKLTVLVKGDQGVPYGKVVAAMNILKQAGAETVGLLTDNDVSTEESA